MSAGTPPWPGILAGGQEPPAELPPSRCKAQLVWEAMFVSCHLEREQSDKGDSLETSFSVFILTMRVEHKASDTFDKTYYF